MPSPTTTILTPSPLQRRGLSFASEKSLLMPKRFSEGGLPMPSSSPARRGLLPLSQRSRRRLIVGVLVVIAFGFFSMMTGGSKSHGVASAPHADTTRHGVPGLGYEREVSGLDEDDMLAENEVAVDSEREETPKSNEEKEADEAAMKQKEQNAKDDKKDQVRALIWWIYNGGSFDAYGNYKALKEDQLKRMSGRQFEKYLVQLGSATQPTPSPFSDSDWVRKAKLYNSVTIFSKSYCPYSMRAKSIMEEYPIQPSPYIVELDLRDDGSILQDYLLTLTGRRTVPNIITGFESLGGSDELNLLHMEGVLGKRLMQYHRIS